MARQPSEIIALLRERYVELSQGRNLDVPGSPELMEALKELERGEVLCTEDERRVILEELALCQQVAEARRAGAASRLVQLQEVRQKINQIKRAFASARPGVIFDTEG